MVFSNSGEKDLRSTRSTFCSSKSARSQHDTSHIKGVKLDVGLQIERDVDIRCLIALVPRNRSEEVEVCNSLRLEGRFLGLQ